MHHSQVENQVELNYQYLGEYSRSCLSNCDSYGRQETVGCDAVFALPQM